jgi:hypothetical protein
MEVITDRFFTGGNHVIEFNRRGLPPGMYYYSLEMAGTHRQWHILGTKKMILMQN